MTRPRRVALVSLGCPKNQVDSELILGRLRAEGWELVGDADEADTLVVNTCAFIDKARAESVEALVEAADWKARRPGRRVVAAGCLVQRYGGELAAELPELDGLIGLDGIRGAGQAVGRGSLARVPALPGPATGLFDHHDPRVRLSSPWTAYVKIAEGCNQSCSFCAIPSFRGRMRSRPLDDLAAEMSQLAREGVVEANLVAQDSTGYGRDLGLADGLAELLRALDALAEAPAWIRVHYLYPGRISRALLDALAASRRIVEYIDLPLQHAHPAVLKRMLRPGNAESHLRQLDELRAALPGAGVRSAFIVGFPGETEDEFAALVEFVEKAGLDAAGVFTYSHEEGTTAESLPDGIPEELKEERRQVLEDVAAAVALARNQARVGQELQVLVEGPAEDEPGAAAARWRGQAPEVDGRVLLPGQAGLRPGTLLAATVTEARPQELVARPAGAGTRS
ncbi:MAG: 30S ribosomal protein S12 methylthiotransferase RimO [Acidobacteria bacterium]|nr:30S ribosomal protein S12 methylthiotransferase RimO [Acidobacteriota bacterium]